MGLTAFPSHCQLAHTWTNTKGDSIMGYFDQRCATHQVRSLSVRLLGRREGPGLACAYSLP